MSEYTPTTQEIQVHYLALAEDRPAFDRWLRKVQAEAWEEGYLDGDADRIYGTGTENPYREDLLST